MVCTVTLNPALDCYLSLEELALGRINRYEDMRLAPGGKGVNVSLLLRSLGVRTVAMGVAAGFTGRELLNMLDRLGCLTDFILLPRGETRLNLKLAAPGLPETALNGPGPEIPEEILLQLEQRLAVDLHPGDCLVIAGSQPASLPEDACLRLCRTVPQEVKVVLDTSGPALKAGLAAKPFLVKPNLEELGELFGRRLSQKEEALYYGKKLLGMGPKNVLVSMGSQGALLLTEDGGELWRDAIPGEEVSSVGAGDSMVAGFLYGWLQSGSMEEALDWGVGAGAATAFCQGLASPDSIREIMRDTRVKNTKERNDTGHKRH